MTLQYQKLEIPFGYGQDEGVATFAIQPPRLQVARNARINKEGSIEKREGYRVLASVSGATRLANWNDSLCVVTTSASPASNASTGLYVLNSDKARGDKQGQGDPTGTVPEYPLVGRLRIGRSTGLADQTRPDEAIALSYYMRLVVWQQEGPTGDQRIYATVTDLDTGAVITGPQLVSTGATAGQAATAPRAIFHNAQLIVCYREDGTSTIWARAYNCSTRTWGTDTAIITDANTTGIMDACELSGAADTNWYVAYRSTAPGVRIKKMTNLTVTTTVSSADDPTGAIGIYADNTYSLLWIAYNVVAVGARVMTHHSSTLVAGLAATTIDASQQWDVAVVAASATMAVVVGTRAKASNLRPIAWYRTITTGAVLGTAVVKYGVAFVSKPTFGGPGQVLAWMLYDGAQDTSATDALNRVSDSYAVYLLVSLCGDTAYESTATRSWRVLASAATGVAAQRPGGLSRTNVTLVSGAIVGETPLAVDYILEPNPTTGTIAGRSGVDVFRFGGSSRYSFAELGGLLWIGGGGATMIYDGAHLVEHGFYYPPENGQMAVSAGGSLTAGAYAVSLTYEYTMATGARMISQPVAARTSGGATSITAALNDDIDLVVNTLTLTQKHDPVYAAASGVDTGDTPVLIVYRTEANGSLLYEDTSTTGSVLTNVSGVITAARVINQTDAVLIGHRPLYTTDGILPAYPLPSCDVLVSYHNRIWGIWTEDQTQLVFTQPQQDGEVPYWHPFLALRVDQDGPCTALAVMGDTLIVFKKQAIYAVRGNGPDRKGQNSDIQAPQRISSAYGTTKPRSVVVTPVGVFFHCDGLGICVLDTGFGVALISGPIETTLLDTGTPALVGCNFTSAVANVRSERVYFTAYAGASANRYGYTLVYDWAWKAWYTDVLQYETGGTQYDVGIGDAISSGGNYYALNIGGNGAEPPAGRILKEDSTGDFYNDATLDAWVPLDIRTGWLQPAGPQGFQRIRRFGLLGEYQGGADLTVSLSYNFGEATASYTRTNAENIAGDPDGFTMWHLQWQRCTSLRIRILDSKPSGGALAQGYRFTGLAFEVGLKPGLAKRPAVQLA